mmetsp:Transcript_93084/g.268875  ORF Transcript_93084/g.268875 Transcript_93084/m.268875 type:complete len:139 (-) Transcript_93084:228-644(-)
MSRMIAAILALAVVVAGAYTGCSDAEVKGIKQCESAGEGFLRDQNKATTCPENVDVANFTCDHWKCHMYCVNPVNGDDRKSCDNCEVPAVGDTCFSAQKTACSEAKAAGCDVDCNSASGDRRALTAILAALSVVWQLS